MYVLMKADYKCKEGITGTFEAEVILPQPMTAGDGFTLLGFDDWEYVSDEKISSAITNIVQFKIIRNSIGFMTNEK